MENILIGTNEMKMVKYDMKRLVFGGQTCKRWLSAKLCNPYHWHANIAGKLTSYSLSIFYKNVRIIDILNQFNYKATVFGIIQAYHTLMYLL